MSKIIDSRQKTRPGILLILFAVAFGALFLIGATVPTRDAELISIGIDGQAGSGGYYAFSESSPDAVSADGRFVVFSSIATNLTDHDVSGWHVYLRDRETETTTLVTDTGGDFMLGSQVDGQAVISADGRYVAFKSDAYHGMAHIYLYDRLNPGLEMVSISSDGTPGTGCSCGWPDTCNGCESHLVNANPSISSDGRYVAFTSYADNFVNGDLPDTPDVFVRDRQEGTTTIISSTVHSGLGNGGSWDPSISADGSFIAFTSAADNLDMTDFNEYLDVFLWCRTTNSIRRISVSSDGEEGNLNSQEPAISADGNLIAFTSGATNLAGPDTNGYTYDVFIRDEAKQTTSILSSGIASGGRRPAISDDGQFVSFTTGRDEIQLQNVNTSQRQLLSSNMQFSALDESGSVIVMSGYDPMAPDIDTNGDKDVYLVVLDGSAPPGEAEICNDGIDNDGDGLTDCLDKLDCRQDPACKTTGGGGGGGGGGTGGGGGGGKNR
jgi:Tol biopolymer transport system component